MAKIKKMKDHAGKTEFPVTVADAVLMGNGKTLKGELTELGSQVIYDVSANNDGATFPSLSALLSSENLSTLIPIAVRCGGMNIRFAQTSDNKYVQYRLMADAWSTDVRNWSFCGDDILVNNPEFIRVYTDKDGRILWAVKNDGTIYYGAGVPQQVVDYINDRIAELELDKVEDIVTFLGDLVEGDTLATLLNGKVDKETGKSLIQTDVAENVKYVESPEWQQVITDCDGRVLEGIDAEGIHKDLLPLSVNDLIVNGRITQKLDKYLGINDVFLKNGFMPLANGDFNVNLTKAEFIELYNSNLSTFCSLNKCHDECMYTLAETDSEETIYWKINHNFRNNVVFEGMSRELFMSQLNKYFSIQIHRFDCATLNNGNEVHASIKMLPLPADYVNKEGDATHSFKCVYSNTGHEPTTDEWVSPQRRYWEVVDRDDSYPIWQSDITYHCEYTLAYEPSSLISDDKRKIELFVGGGKRFDFDGLTWEQKAISFDFGTPLYHPSCNKVDGKYMWLAPISNGSTNAIGLYESSDGMSFVFKGFMKGTACGDNIGNGQSFSALGNSYLFKLDNIYYLFLEGTAGNGWEITIRICTDIYYDNGDGTIGNWVASSENPILPAVIQGKSSKGLRNFYNTTFCPGNPEILKGQDNQPIRIDGKYYMVFHGCYNDSIEKAYSYDLIHWIWEGNILNQRDIPDGGWSHGDVTDHSLCEFKGRTYLFYSHNMNSYGYSCENIRYQIDDRPLSELVKLKF